jgi:hypothetical protein
MKRILIAAVLAIGLTTMTAGSARAGGCCGPGGGCGCGFNFSIGLSLNFSCSGCGGCGSGCCLSPCCYPPPCVYSAMPYGQPYAPPSYPDLHSLAGYGAPVDYHGGDYGHGYGYGY